MGIATNEKCVSSLHPHEVLLMLTMMTMMTSRVRFLALRLVLVLISARCCLGIKGGLLLAGADLKPAA